MNELVEFIHYDREVFRAFSSAHPSQDLFDDLLPDRKDQEIVKPFYYPEETGPISSPTERVFRHSDQKEIQQEISSKFKPENWYASRYSDGTWGVLYSAELQETAVAESLYHKRNFYREEIEQKPLQIDLRVVRLKLKSSFCVDLLSDGELDREKLCSKDESGYPYCQNLGKKYRQGGAQLLRTPSARLENAVCVPIFDPKTVKEDYGHLKYLKCILGKEETEIYEVVPRFV